MKEIINKDNKEKILLTLCGFLGGVIIGLLLSPTNKDACCGSKKGNKTYKETVDEFDDDVLHFN